jgi:hypothetical protein|tara:strand:- start:2006 stop:2218 length:213 start_codon:yes stop_codon:yes gene_type:complete
MTLTKKQITNVFIALGVLVLIYANRGSLHPSKAPLNANEDSDDAIDRAISKLKSGGVAVKSTPEEATKSV